MLFYNPRILRSVLLIDKTDSTGLICIATQFWIEQKPRQIPRQQRLS